MKIVFLVGFAACGKSTLLKNTAQYFEQNSSSFLDLYSSYSFEDLDVRHAQKFLFGTPSDPLYPFNVVTPSPEIASSKFFMMSRFRFREEMLLREWLKNLEFHQKSSLHILALGGGTLLPSIWDLLKFISHDVSFIYLPTPWEIIWKRFCDTSEKSSWRQFFFGYGEKAEEKCHLVYQARTWWWEKLCEIDSRFQPLQLNHYEGHQDNVRILMETIFHSQNLFREKSEVNRN